MDGDLTSELWPADEFNDVKFVTLTSKQDEVEVVYEGVSVNEAVGMLVRAAFRMCQTDEVEEEE